MLERAARYVKPKGRIVYVTCSLLRDENEDRIGEFLSGHKEFLAIPAQEIAEKAGLPELARFASPHGVGLRFSPLASGTDGFFVAALQKGDIAPAATFS